MLALLRWLTCLGLAALMVFQVASVAVTARADSAPMWESPVGLKPGLLDNKVRMVAETVDLQMIERDGANYVKVNALFDLLNRGPDIRMKVGFPGYNYPVNVGGYPKQVGFSPSQLANFRAWSGTTQYQPRKEKVVLDDGMSNWGTEWFVWDMAFPRGAPVRLSVSYDQKLSEDKGAVSVFYVLTSGALWDDTIGDATITVSAPDGGAFLAADPETSEFGGSLVVWHMHDFEPADDVRAIYVPAATWQNIRAAEDAMASGTASASDYIAGARAVYQMTEDGTRAGEDRQMLRELYYPRAKEWARLAMELDAENWAPWDVLGQLEDALARYQKGNYRCWPQAAIDAHRQAMELGSPTAAEHLRQMQEELDWMESVMGPLEPCS